MRIVKLEKQITLLRTAAFQKLLLLFICFLKSSLRFSFPSGKKKCTSDRNIREAAQRSDVHGPKYLYWHHICCSL